MAEALTADQLIFTAPDTDTDRYLISQVRSREEFRALRDEWDVLAANVGAPSVLGTWEAVDTWLNSFVLSDSRLRGQSQLRLLVARDRRGSCVGIAPLYARSGPCDAAKRCIPPARSGYLSRAYSREWRLVGDLGRYGEAMTEEPLLLLKAGCESRLVQAFTSYICADSDGDWDIFKLRAQLPAGEPPLNSLVVPSEFAVERRSNEGSQVAPLADDWPAFRRGLSRSMRDNLAYYPRLLDRRGHQWSVESVRSPDGIRKSANLLIALHRERAKFNQGASHTNHIPTDVHAEFLKSILENLSLDGRASIWLLKIDGSVAAAQAFLEYRGQLMFYYSGFQEQWREYSPLTILAARVIEDACARGLTSVNFLPGAEAWKSRWGAKTAYRIDDVQCLRRRPLSFARIFVRSTAREFAHSIARRAAANTASRRPSDHQPPTNKPLSSLPIQP